MITVGIDDTDTIDTPGTNQLARALARRLAPWYRTVLIVRHQLLDDPRVPYTSKNGSASMLLGPRGPVDRAALIASLRAGMREWFVPGSDPGLCVAFDVPAEVMAYARRCQRELVSQAEARQLAARLGIHLEGLGGTEGGVIGALAAVGLAATGDDGRVVHIGDWPDDLSGPQEVRLLHERGVEVVCEATGEPVSSGLVDVGKHLRPNRRGGRNVLFVAAAEAEGAAAPWVALRRL